MRSILIQNKRGDIIGLLYLIVMIAAFAFFLLIVGYLGNEINTRMKTQLNSSNSEINEAFDASVNVSRQTLSALWFIMFGGLLLGLLITAWYMPTNPLFVPVFIILLVVAIIVGVAMSNAYEVLYANTTLEDIAETQTSINFIMDKLPYTALIVGIISLIVTFAKPKSEGAPIM